MRCGRWDTPRAPSVRHGLDSENPIAAADAGSTRAHGLEDGCAVDRLQERVELRPGPGELDRVVPVGHVDDPPAKDVRHALHLLAVLAYSAHFNEHQLALDVLAVRKVDDLDDV